MTAAIESLDVPTLRDCRDGLCDLLVACVAAGASVSYVEPPTHADAGRFWDGVADAVAAGRRVALVARDGGHVAGTVQLDLVPMPNQPHRAEVMKLLVHPDARRRGLGAALMRAAEAEALTRGRWLMTLDTRAGDDAERLYRRLGWTEAGRIPRFALSAEGSYDATVIFYRLLA